MNWKILRDLIYRHSTPGDEGDVMSLMRGKWESEGWCVRELGGKALVARSPGWRDGRPSVLICAHADSPGYIIQSLVSDNEGNAIALGGPHLRRSEKAVSIKARDGRVFRGKIRSSAGGERFTVSSVDTLERGGRICWRPFFQESGDYITTPFLDNRIGCFILHCLSEHAWNCNVELAVTGTEEFLGFGAAALAANVKPDLVLVLDVTYVDNEQHVLFGQGPVVTVCDKSIALSPQQVNALFELCGRWGLPLQDEYYDYSGTDAVAFGRAGHTCPVLPLLVPTEGSHSSREKLCKADVLSLMELLTKIVENLDETIEFLKRRV